MYKKGDFVWIMENNKLQKVRVDLVVTTYSLTPEGFPSARELVRNELDMHPSKEALLKALAEGE